MIQMLWFRLLARTGVGHFSWEFPAGQFPPTVSLVECIVVILLNLLLIMIYFTHEYGDIFYLFVIIGRPISLIFLIIS